MRGLIAVHVLLGVRADTIAERGEIFAEAAGGLARAETADEEETGEQKE